jgi:hypothetical protein
MNLCEFNFKSIADPNAKKDAKKVPSIVVCVSENGGEFSMGPRSLNTILNDINTRIDTLKEDDEDLSIETVSYQKLVNWTAKIKDGNNILAYVGMTSGYSTDDEPLRSFFLAANDHMASEESVFGQGYIMSNVSYETILDLTLDEYQQILTAKLAEVTETDLLTVKENAKSKAKKNGLKDGKLILKAPKAKKEATV